MVKLDAMENPYQWPDDIKAQWLALLSEAQINRYPDPSARQVTERLRAVMDVAEQHEIILGNGSDEIILLLAMLVADGQKTHTLLTVEPGFVMYRQIAEMVGLDYQAVPLTASFEIDLEAMLAAIAEHQPAIIFLAQPNNPTGNLFDADAVRAIIEAAPGLVILDEAYLPFTDNNSLPLAEEFDHVLVMRTLSKAGLAGLRLGLLIGNPAWLAELDKIRLPYNINELTQLSAQFALDHYALLTEQTQAIRQAREQQYQQLKDLPGVETWSSEANFLLLRTPAGQAKAIHQALKQQGILIKCLDGVHPLLHDCLRITIGLPEENAALLTALTAQLESP